MYLLPVQYKQRVRPLWTWGSRKCPGPGQFHLLHDHRIIQAGRDLKRSSNPTSFSNQGQLWDQTRFLKRFIQSGHADSGGGGSVTCNTLYQQLAAVRTPAQLEEDLPWLSPLPKRCPLRGGTNQSAAGLAWTGNASVLIYMVHLTWGEFGDLLDNEGFSSPAMIERAELSLTTYTRFLQNLGSSLWPDHTHQIRHHNRLKNSQFTSLGRSQRLRLGSWHYYDWRMHGYIQR